MTNQNLQDFRDKHPLLTLSDAEIRKALSDDKLAWYPDEREDGYPDVDNFEFFHIDTLPLSEAWSYVDCGSAGERRRACERLLLKLYEQTPTQAQHIEQMLDDNLAFRRLQLAAIVRWFENGKAAVPEIAGYVTDGFHGRNGDWRIVGAQDGEDNYVVSFYAPGADDPAFEVPANGLVEALVIASKQPFACGVHHETGWRWEATWDNGSYWVRWYAQGCGDGMPTRFDRVLSLENMQPPREVFHAHRAPDIF